MKRRNDAPRLKNNNLPSSLHRKRIFSLFFLFCVNTASGVRGVSFGSRHEFQKEGTNNCASDVSSERGECANNPPTISKANRARRWSNNRKLVDECCLQCPECRTKEGSHTAEESAGATPVVATPYGIPLQAWKILMQICLTAINVFFWLVPLHWKEISENKLALSIANSFSGGVFLSLAFGHLVPECVHGFEGLNDALPYMLVLAGYMLIFFVEKVAFDAHGLMHDVEKGENQVSTSHQLSQNGGGGGEKEVPDGGEAAGTGRGAVILLGALAVHSVLEMTALGLANTFGKASLLSLSIALHQPAESIALLVAFLKSGMTKGQIMRFLGAFSACGPIGVAIGMAVQSFAVPIVDAVMLAVVAGTFVYVGATEVIPEEFEEQDRKWTKFFALITGIVSIFAITQYTQMLETGE